MKNTSQMATTSLTRPSDYVKTAVSLATVALRRPFALLASVVPHLVVLGAFGAFVLWNNGVVLGEIDSSSSVMVILTKFRPQRVPHCWHSPGTNALYLALLCLLLMATFRDSID